jgi:hypothetical protein
MTAPIRNDQDRLIYRMMVLPGQLTKARLKVRRLEREAEEYRMFDLLTKPEAINTMWELEVARGKAK